MSSSTPAGGKGQVAPDGRSARHAVGRLPDVQLAASAGILGEVPVLSVSSNTSLTAFASVMALHSNTPDQKGSTRAQIAQFGHNYLMTNDPSSPLYYKFNFYHVPTDSSTSAFGDDAGHGWSIDNKTYTIRVLQQPALQRPDVDHRDERHRQAEQLPEVGQPPAGPARVELRRLPHRAMVGVRLDRSLPDAVGSAHLGRRRAAELPRDIRHDDISRTPNTSCACGRTSASRLASSWPTTSRTSRSLPTTARSSAASTARRTSSTRSRTRRRCRRSTPTTWCSPTGRSTGSTAAGRTFRRRACST